jgi:hypothetical protein
VDEHVTGLLLAALAPAALEVSLAAAGQAEAQRAQVDRIWRQRLERAEFAADRARRQYQLVEPENRLVARQLEKDWEAALAGRQRLGEEYDRFTAARPRTLTAAEREQIRALAADLPAVWNAPTTTDADRKQLIRHLVEQVRITVLGTSEKVDVEITWAGGHRTAAQITRPVACLTQLSYYPRLAARARELAGSGCTIAQIAGHLNAEGFRPPKRGPAFTLNAVSDLLRVLGIQRSGIPARRNRPALAGHEWWLHDLAAHLGMSEVTLGRAKLGYLNYIDHSDGRVIRTIIIDPERAPMVKLAFELYATGDYSLDELADELYDRRLRTGATNRHPAKKVSINKLSQMLRDRYYLGYVDYKGEEIRGRHEVLIDDEELVDQVQEILESRLTAKERRRVHHHYLKGSVYCGYCRRAGKTERLAIQRTVNRHGYEYLYFFCRNKRDGICPVHIYQVEEAIERHYANIRFHPEFIADVGAHIDTVINEQEAAARLLHKQISSQLRELDTKEENLIDLAADGTLPQTKVKAKLRDIGTERRRLTQRLDTASADLTDSARLIQAALKVPGSPRRALPTLQRPATAPTQPSDLPRPLHRGRPGH